MEALREHNVATFQTILGLSETEARDAEIGAYNTAIDWAEKNGIPRTWASPNFTDNYKAMVRKVYWNIMYTPRVGARIAADEIKPHDVAHMSRYDLYPELWTGLSDQEMDRLRKTLNMTQTSMTDTVFCRKCHKNKISYFELQTRSADEPMTTFYRCLSCGHHWRQ